MKKAQSVTELSFQERKLHKILEVEGEPVLELTLHWLSGGEGCSQKLKKLLELPAAVWQARWTGLLYQRACAVRADCRARSRPFLPWSCGLDTTVTHNRDGLCSISWEAWERAGEQRRSLVRHSLVWDWRIQAPLPLSSFFAGQRRWRRLVLQETLRQAEQRLDSGESLLDQDPAGLRKQFSPQRFRLHQDRVEIWYPLCSVASYGEGIPSFAVGPAPSPLPSDQDTSEPDLSFDKNQTYL